VRKRVVGVTIGVCVALWLPAAAPAAPTWLAASPLSQTGAEFADTAMGSDGGAAVTWLQPSAGGRTVQVALRGPLGSFAPALDVSPGAEIRAPQVAVDAAGDATVVWYGSEGSNFLAEAATVMDGMPSAPVKLSEPGENAIFPTVAMNDRGDTIVAWTREEGANVIVQASFRPAGGSFSTPVSLSAKGQFASLPRVAIDAAGDATVVWDVNNGKEVVEQATRSAATGSFSKPEVLSNVTEPALYPFVAMNAEGDTAVTWIGFNGTVEIVQVAVRPAGGKFDKAVNVSGEGESAQFPQVALDGRGDPSVVWAREFVVQYASGTTSGTFPSVHSLAFLSWAPSIAEDAAGDTLVGYANLQNESAVAVFRPAGGSFGEPQEVSPTGQTVTSNGESDEQGLNVAIDGDGNGLVGFTSQSAELAEESQLDTVGPTLENVSIPASATAGVPVNLSVAPVDEVDPMPEVSWSFGDASTASGVSVTHTFASPGTYSVSVTATVAPGDSVTQTGSITVAAPIGKAPPPTPTFHAAVLGSATVTADRHGRLQLKIACPAAGAACTGTVALTLPATATGLAVAARARANGAPVTVAAGQAPFNAAPGASAAVGISLPATVAKLLARYHRLTLTAILETHGSSGQSLPSSAQVLVKAPAAPGRPKGKRKKR
jgi:PKD repeat protein